MKEKELELKKNPGKQLFRSYWDVLYSRRRRITPWRWWWWLHSTTTTTTTTRRRRL